MFKKMLLLGVNWLEVIFERNLISFRQNQHIKYTPKTNFLKKKYLWLELVSTTFNLHSALKTQLSKNIIIFKLKKINWVKNWLWHLYLSMKQDKTSPNFIAFSNNMCSNTMCYVLWSFLERWLTTESKTI